MAFDVYTDKNGNNQKFWLISEQEVTDCRFLEFIQSAAPSAPIDQCFAEKGIKMSSSAPSTVRRVETAGDKKEAKESKGEPLIDGLPAALIRVVLMVGICYVAYTIRLHAVNVYGRVIHEV
jgi:hypothetical protein